jgi:hypothetical protein
VAPPASGLLILDNNVFSRLLHPGEMARLLGNTRAADLVLQPTEINLLEMAAAPEPVRTQLIGAMRQAAEGMALLPWPIKLLKGIGQAIADGEPTYRADASGAEWYLDDQAALSDLRDAVLRFNQRLEEAFNELHEKSRRRVTQMLRTTGGRDEHGSARAFIDGEWVNSDLRRAYAEVTWSALDLPGDAPITALEQNEAWRLLLDAEGAALYERALARQQPRRVQRMDLLQLIYLAGARRRILVTSDRGLLRVADAILPGRYLNARAVSADDFLD